MFSAATKSGKQASAANYIEDVFSTWLYTGTGAAQTITNNINLSTYGGLVWIKDRTNAYNHNLFDTAQGATKLLHSNTTGATVTDANSLTAFTASGFTLGSGNTAGNQVNTSTDNFVSWTFRKQAKFFDVVTYTGNGSGSRSIAHSLGSVPGFIIVKATSTTGNWAVWHRSTTFAQGYLNTTDAFSGIVQNFPTDQTSSTTFDVYGPAFGSIINTNGVTYVAYLFAHNAGGFGLTGTDNVISCGSYVGNGSTTGPTITLGYEPQWIMVKSSSAASNWIMLDNMRGVPTGGFDSDLYANLTYVGSPTVDFLDFTATGFIAKSNNSETNASGATYIYIAIRRGPMKTPTSGTSVFTPVARTGNGSAGVVSLASFPLDAVFTGNRNNGGGTPVGKFMFASRLTDSSALRTNDQSAEVTTSFFTSPTFSSMTGVNFGTNGSTNEAASTYINYAFQRSPKFFDVVCYTGNGATQAVSHNLGVAPLLMLVKNRAVADWWVYSSTLGSGSYIILNSNTGSTSSVTAWNNTAPTGSVFTVGTSSNVNASANSYIAYLFASCPGVSQVGNYTGNGTTQTINCGFTGGARFVLIKRTDTTGDWYVWDTARGMVAGTDPSLLLNSTAAEVNANSVYTTTGGFQIVSTAAGINASGGTYIFLAIA